MLDCGLAMTGPDYPAIAQANRLLEGDLPDELSPDAAVASVEAHFTARGVKCHQWIMNPSAPRPRVDWLIKYLASHGYSISPIEVLHLPRVAIPALPSPPSSQSPSSPPTSPPVTIIPARAGYGPLRRLFAMRAEECASPPRAAEAAEAHLDDPNYDALLALGDGEPLAVAGVLAVGEIGLCRQLYVAPNRRGAGLGRLMLLRVQELCARSLFRQVLASPHAGTSPAYQRAGFRPVGALLRAVAP